MIKTSYFSRTSAQIIAGHTKTDEEKKRMNALKILSHCDAYSQRTFSYMEVRIAEPIIKRIVEEGGRHNEWDIPDDYEITMLRELTDALHCDEGYYGPVIRTLCVISRYLRQKIYGDGLEVWKEVKDYP